MVANKHIPVLVSPDKVSRDTPKRGWTAPLRLDAKCPSQSKAVTYRKRKQTVEPVFGHTKHNRGSPTSTDEADKVRTECRLLMMTHNLGKAIATN